MAVTRSDGDQTDLDHDIVDALEQLEAGESYRSVANETPNVTRQTLMNIDNDDERRAWYLDGEIEDKRVSEAWARSGTEGPQGTAKIMSKKKV